MSFRLMIAAPLAGLLLTGCDTQSRGSGSPDPAFSEAVRYDAAIQTIDPDPVYTENDAKPGDSGAKGAAAVKRYRTDAVKEVQKETTTSGSSSGPR